jgi:hypothetical protein
MQVPMVIPDHQAMDPLMAPVLEVHMHLIIISPSPILNLVIHHLSQSHPVLLQHLGMRPHHQDQAQMDRPAQFV